VLFRSESHYLVDVGQWHQIAERVFVAERDGLVPGTDFGFDAWRGATAIDEGYARSMPRFAAAVHACSNVHLTVDGDRAVARYYLQGWHWFADTPAGAREAQRNADYLIVGVMTDDILRQDGRWRIHRRRLERLGPGPAIGSLPPWLDGLGVGRPGASPDG
jgi:hypothetical protein